MRKCALVTGASCGIGYEFAKILAKEGYNLILVARSAQKLEDNKQALEKEYNITVKVIILDLSTPDAAEKLVDEVKKENCFVDVLINNAGFGDYSMFVDCDLQKQEQMINLNVLTLAKLTRLILPDMIKQRSGKILNVASIVSFLPGPHMAIYYATKAFVLSFSQSLANEVKGTGVTVTALCPGMTDTNFSNVASLGHSKLNQRFKAASAVYVAKYGYKRMMKGKLLAIPRFENKIIAAIVPFFPRTLVSATVRKVQEKVHV